MTNWIRMYKRKRLTYELVDLVGRILPVELQDDGAIYEGRFIPMDCYESVNGGNLSIVNRNGKIRRVIIDTYGVVTDYGTGEVIEDIYLHLCSLDVGTKVMLDSGEERTVLFCGNSGFRDTKGKTTEFANVDKVIIRPTEDKTCEEAILTGTNLEKAIAISDIVIGTDIKSLFHMLEMPAIKPGDKIMIRKPEGVTWPSWCAEMDKSDGQECTIKSADLGSFRILENPGWVFPNSSAVAPKIGDLISKMTHDDLLESAVRYTLMNKEQAEEALKRRFK